MAVIRVRLAPFVPWLCFAQPGRDWGIERSTYKDPVTGVTVTELPGGSSRPSNLYCHFSNFTADGRYVILTSDPAASNWIYPAEVSTGRVVHLTAGPGVAAGTACPHPADPSRLFYAAGSSLVDLDLEPIAEPVIGAVPPPVAGSLRQPILSHDGRNFALGFAVTIGLGTSADGPRFWSLPARHHSRVSPRARATSPVHASCLLRLEAGGYAPQRTWIVESGGSRHRPFYFRTDPKDWLAPLKEWVTHEAGIAGTGAMTVILDQGGHPGRECRRRRPPAARRFLAPRRPARRSADRS